MPKFEVIVYRETWTAYHVDAKNGYEAQDKLFNHGGDMPEPVATGDNEVSDVIVTEIKDKPQT